MVSNFHLAPPPVSVVGVRNDNNSLSTDLLHRDGHSFAFILHYIITGDLVYPLHQGFHRVDALLKVKKNLPKKPVISLKA